jgi:hypothetical protein
MMVALAIAGCSSSMSKPDGGTGAAGTSGSGVAGNAAGGSSGGGSGASVTGGSGGSAIGGSGGSAAGGAGGTGTAGSASGGSGGGTDASVWDQVDASSDGLLEYLHTEVDAARSLWASTKGNCAIYNYDRRWISTFSGAVDSTQIEVRNDVVTRRRISMGNMYVDGGAWTRTADETGSQIGQYPSGVNFGPPSTMEQLFTECETNLARNPADYSLNLELDPARGIPLRCTYRPIGCADDCTFGFIIASFACTPLPDGGPI